ncbi:hypothetical protein F2Q68_00028729 [Brassica cretica]|uniref:Uncharacterized protein n=1 Tax=Brassica cretica TaxID=69181 RepID=A0A8S9GB05_BRACR|nr:hypothetical protein F2Q68_00028729 [Brassica cretica]
MLLPPVIFFHASEYTLARAIHGPSRGNSPVNLQASAFNTFTGSSLQPPILLGSLYSEQKNEEIAEMVKRVMDEEEGKEMRQNVKELKMKTAEEAVMKLSTPQAD